MDTLTRRFSIVCLSVFTPISNSHPTSLVLNFWSSEESKEAFSVEFVPFLKEAEWTEQESAVVIPLYYSRLRQGVFAKYGSPPLCQVLRKGPTQYRRTLTSRFLITVHFPLSGRFINRHLNPVWCYGSTQ